MQEGLARGGSGAPGGSGAGAGERERATRHRGGVDLAREGFPSWGEGGGGAGAGPSAAPPPAPPHPARPGPGGLRTRCSYLTGSLQSREALPPGAGAGPGQAGAGGPQRWVQKGTGEL